MERTLNKAIISECRTLLLKRKSELLNSFQTYRRQLQNTEFTGNEADLSSSLTTQNMTSFSVERSRQQLFDIEQALHRIDLGEYGICEETFLPIECERLLAVPWTRLSIEGAELREAMGRQFSHLTKP